MALKKKLNFSGGLDKELKARICLRGDIQINNGDHSWSPIAPIRLLKCFIAVVPFVAISSKVKYKYRLEISYQTLAIHEFLACHLHNIIYLYHFNNITLAIHQIHYQYSNLDHHVDDKHNFSTLSVLVQRLPLVVSIESFLYFWLVLNTCHITLIQCYLFHT